jgi:hypothetical protein
MVGKRPVGKQHDIMVMPQPQRELFATTACIP